MNLTSIPKTVPVSDIKNKPGEVFELVGDGPILLTSRGVGTVVMVSVDEWNEIVAQLEERKYTKANMDALAYHYEHKDKPKEWIDGEDLKAMMAEKNGHVANPV